MKPLEMEYIGIICKTNQCILPRTLKKVLCINPQVEEDLHSRLEGNEDELKHKTSRRNLQR